LAPQPDVAIYLDIRPEVAVERIIKRDESSKKREELCIAFMNDVRQNFLNQPWRGVFTELCVIDAENSPKDIEDELWQLIMSKKNI
jgi:thymidylate kinase